MNKIFSLIHRVRCLFALLPFLFISCASTLPSEDQAKISALKPLIDAGNSEACFRAGKIYNSRFYNSTNVQPAIEILTRGAKFNTPEARTEEYAASCASELRRTYSSMSYAMLFQNDQNSAEHYHRKAKEMLLYLHQLGYNGGLSADGRRILQLDLDEEDRAFDFAINREQRSRARDRVSNAQLMQQVGAGIVQSGQLAAQVVDSSHPPPAASSSRSTGSIGILSHGGIYGTASSNPQRFTPAVPAKRHPDSGPCKCHGTLPHCCRNPGIANVACGDSRCMDEPGVSNRCCK